MPFQVVTHNNHNETIKAEEYDVIIVGGIRVSWAFVRFGSGLQTAPVIDMHGREIVYHRGKLLAGSSSIKCRAPGFVAA